MRALLVFIGWSSVMGSLADGSIGLYAHCLAGVDRWMDIGMTVDELLRRLLSPPPLDDAARVLRSAAGRPACLFSIRAPLCIPVRITVSAVIGARYLNPGHASEAIPNAGNGLRQ